jgi:excisionase family DNA binding protein
MPKKKAANVQLAVVAPEPRYLTIKAAAAYASLTVWFVRELIWARKISFARLGNRYVIDKESLDTYMQAQMVRAPLTETRT